jgi:hypothetical protein
MARAALKREGGISMAKIVILSRARYWYLAVSGWMGGFFLYYLLAKYARPQVVQAVVPFLPIIVIVLTFTGMRASQPHFLKTITADQFDLLGKFNDSSTGITSGSSS